VPAGAILSRLSCVLVDVRVASAVPWVLAAVPSDPAVRGGRPGGVPFAAAMPDAGVPGVSAPSAAAVLVSDVAIDLRSLAVGLVGGAVGFLLAAACVGFCCVVLRRADRVNYTADGDPYTVVLANNAEVQAARFGAFDSSPPGIAGIQVQGSRAEPTDSELAQCTLEAEQIATAECCTRAAAVGDLGLLPNLRSLVGPGGGGVAAPSACAGPVLGSRCGAAVLPAGAPGGDLAGVRGAAASEGGCRIGDEVLGREAPAARALDRDLHVVPDGQGLPVELGPPAAPEAFLRKAVDADTRILPIVRDGQGRGGAPWHKTEEMTRQEDFGSDGLLPCPMTAAGCMSYLQWEGLSTEGHHEHLTQVCRLAATDWGVQVHYDLWQQIRAATSQGLLDGANLTSIEMKFGRRRTFEVAHWDKAVDAECKGVGGKMSLKGQAAVSGFSRSTSSVTGSPGLIELVRSDFEKGAMLHMSLRLGREERESRRRPRDILPLPYSSFEEPLDKASIKELARGTMQRIGRMLGVCNDVYACVDAFNWLHDPSLRCGRDRSARYVGPSLAQSQCLARISESVRNLGPPPSTPSPAEALVQLRVAGGAYNVEQSPLGSCDPALLSLPDVSAAPVPLADVWGEGGLPLAVVWGEGGQAKVEQFVLQSLMDPSEAEARLRQSSIPVPYSDPLLRDQRRWSSFVQLLYERRLVDFSLEDGVRAEIFFVKKKGGTLRMVADCRRSNEVFTEPLGARLATGDAFGMLEMAADDSPLTVEGADLKGAFYHLELPEQLPSAKLYPRLRVVPMGWSWAMWWCQSVMERVAEAAGCDDDARLRDGRPAPSLDPSCHLEYVDNFVSIGYDAEAVRSAVTRVMTELKRRGLVVTREEHLGDSEGEHAVLGWSITAAGRLSASASRLWRVRLAVRGLLRRGRASGRDLERVLGHIILVALVRREGLSIFEASFRFVQKCYHQQVPLWSQVRQELMAWDGVAPLPWRDLRAQWSCSVGCVDASPWVLGACEADWDVGAVREVGRRSERWRYGRAERLPPRRRALAAECAADGVAACDLGIVAAQLDPGCPAGDSQPVGPPVEHDLLAFPEVRQKESPIGIPIKISTDQHYTVLKSGGGARKRPAAAASSPLAGASLVRGARRAGLQAPTPPVLQASPASRRGSSGGPTPQQRARLDQPPAGMPELNAASVRTASERQADLSMLVGFDNWTRQPLRAMQEPAQMDRAVCDCISQLVERGDHQTYANPMIAALAGRVPRYARSGQFELPLSKQSAKVWRILAPACGRMAPPCEVVAMVVYGVLHAVGQRSVANAGRGAVAALALRKLGACHGLQLRRSGPGRDCAAGLRDLEQ
ncbi:unnamed protein product, partial [Prorocentrum cordatum]